MSVQKSRRLTVVGIVLGIIVASIASDELILIQAHSQVEKDLAKFYIGIILVVTASITLLTTVGIFETKSIWINFVRSMAATATLINVIFLSIIPQILTWMKS